MALLTLHNARRASTRRAFSLLELLMVLTVMGVVTAAALLRFGGATLAATDAEGFVRRLAQDLRQARRLAIATGADHYVLLNRSSGVVTGYAVWRDSVSGDTQADETVAVPVGASVSGPSDVWNFDFEGALTGLTTGSALRVDGARFYWTLTLHSLTGSVEIDRLPQP